MKSQSHGVFFYLTVLFVAVFAAQSCKQQGGPVDLITTSRLVPKLTEHNYELLAETLSDSEGGVGGDIGTKRYSFRKKATRVIQELVIRKGAEEYRVTLDSDNNITVKPKCPKILLIVEDSRK